MISMICVDGGGNASPLRGIGGFWLCFLYRLFWGISLYAGWYVTEGFDVNVRI
ncbi:hypothetical protein [Pseudanabaena yagii]|uniref:Uncharacterized protein n=1 Tax=Pseudanabaena yagii GIHE-NHR1 TaxID=2722753 RepID=A0ABX1LVL9_9CYAN|nr:hypothetical protein [Pseudanabaena yagii]NMF59545.1 hypothetical protein [Pseudanabaena yagii GIHE-NHR1]